MARNLPSNGSPEHKAFRTRNFPLKGREKGYNYVLELYVITVQAHI